MDSVKDKVWEITCDAGQAEEFQSLYNVTAMRQCREGINMRVLSEEDMEAKGGGIVSRHWMRCICIILLFRKIDERMVIVPCGKII